MKVIRSVLLWLLALVLLAVASWALTLYLEWPLWASAAIFLGVLGLFFLVKFVRRVLLAWRSRSIVARQRQAERDAARRRSPASELRRKFRDAVAMLRGSSLKRLGNPLYVLPWYMVIGRTGAGKTTALARAGLTTSVQQHRPHGDALAQTENCDWWYFDQSVVVDCAGRYVDSGPGDDDDRREWDLVLDLLSRYRGREGLNGLVIALSAERLLAPRRDDLDDEARVVRARIEQMIRLFGKRFPVYVLVTKCDRLYGFEKWSSLLPEPVLDQAMGYLADARDEPSSGDAFVHAAFDSIVSRLRALRIALVAQHPQWAVELLLFPNEVECLEAGLRQFANACLSNSPYLESPFLRGLFLSSGLQEGGARSAKLGATLDPVPAHPPSNTGLFLHDLFGRILPQDRNVSKPAALVNRWFAATQHLGMLSWLLLSIAIGLLMTMSFIRNVDTLALIRNSYPFQQTFTGRLADDATTLSASNAALREIDERNRNWRSRWMMSGDIRDLEDKLHQRYVERYQTYIRPAVQRDLDADLKHALVNDPTGQLPIYILNEIRLTNLLQAKLAGTDRPQLEAMPQPLYSDLARYSPTLFGQINQLRISYLAWLPVHAGVLAERVRDEQATLNSAIYSDQMHWVTELAPLDQHVKPLTLADFWGGPPASADAFGAGSGDNAPPNGQAFSGAVSTAQPAAGVDTGAGTGAGTISTQMQQAAADEQERLAGITVPAAYTRGGHEDIENYLEEARNAVDDGAHFEQQKAAFEHSYQSTRLEAWQNFIDGIPQGERILGGEPAWHAQLAGITQRTSPYLHALDVLNNEFGDLPDASLPGWLQTARHVGRLRAEAIGIPFGGQAGAAVQVINSFGGQAIRQSIANSPTAGAAALRANARAAAALRSYFSIVNRIASAAADGPAKAYAISAAFHGFGVDPAVKTSDVHDAARALATFRAPFGSPEPADQAVWHLIGGPLHFALAYAEQQTSCALQSDWDSKVYWPLQSATSMSQVVDQLYGPQGSVWGFVDGPAKPFLHRAANEISIADTAGYSVPFTDAFLPTLNSAIGKRVAQLLDAQRTKARTAQDEAQAQAAQDEAKQQQANAEQALADLKQQIAAAQAKAYPLTITAQPTDVNPDAKARPFATVLTVQCAGGARTLTNFNFPVSDSFNWAPGQCGETSLLIRFDGLTLSKRYRGDNGLVSFLRDFRDGHHLFGADDFPASRSALATRHLTQITVHYEFRGEDAIIDGAQQVAQLLDDQQHQKQLRQAAIDTMAAQTQQLMLIRMASAGGAPEQPLRVSLPQRIGMCWNAAPAPAQQTLQQMFDSLTDNNGPLLSASAAPQPLPAFAPPTAPDVPPLPSVAPLPTGAAPASGGG